MKVAKFGIGFICACASLTVLSDSRAIPVSTVEELTNAITTAQSGDVITLAAKTYDLTGIPSGTPGHLHAKVPITLQGATDNPEDTIIRGAGGRILYLGSILNIIRNLTFENGDCSSYVSQTAADPKDYPRGGALLFYRENAGVVSNCVFRNNCGGSMGGGAVGCYNSKTYHADFYDCVFSNNTASGAQAYGGAVYMGGDMVRCWFEGNHVDDSNSTGGAIFNAKSMVDCVFTNNVSSKEKGGGAVYMQVNTTTPKPVIAGCKFLFNRSGNYGSAIKLPAGWGENLVISNCLFEGNGPLDGTTVNSTVYLASNVVDCVFRENCADYGVAYQCVLKRCLIERNTTYKGGMAYLCTLVGCTNRSNRVIATNVLPSELFKKVVATDCVFEDFGVSGRVAFGGDVTFDRCRFIAATNGYIFSDTVLLTNCLITSCTTNTYLFFKTDAASRIVNCTIVSNSFAALKTGHDCGKMQIENTFFYGNKLAKGEGNYDIDANATNCIESFSHCIFSSKRESFVPGTDNLNYYGNPSFRPGFVGPEVSPADPYALKRTSPAVKKEGLVGDWMATATDIRGEGYPRLRDGKVNIGCYQCWLDPTGLLLLFR